MTEPSTRQRELPRAVASSSVGRFKKWVHFDVLSPLVVPRLPSPWGVRVYKLSRWWLYGPNATHEDFRELLSRLQPEVIDG